MKSKFVFTMATSLLASVALAQGSSKSTPSATKAKLKLAQSSTATLETAPPAQTPGESSANLSTTVKAPKKFGLAYSIRHDATATTVTQDRDADVLGVHRVTPSYSLSDTKKIRARQEVQYIYSMSKKAGREDGRAVMSDTWVGYLDTKFVSLPYDWNLSLEYRQYLPTGEKSRFITKKLGMELLYLIADKSIGKFEISAHLIPYYHNNTQDFYLDNGKPKANEDYSLEDWVTLGYNITPKIQISHSVGTYNYWKRPIPKSGIKKDTILYNETGIEFKPIKEVSAILSVENDAMIEQNTETRLYHDDDNTYRAYIAISI